MSNAQSDKSPLEEFTDWFSQVQDDIEKRFASDGTVASDGTATSASAEIVVPDSGYGKTCAYPYKTIENLKLENLKKREKRSKFRRIKDISKIRIGDRVRNSNGFPMKVTGIFQPHLDIKDGTLYLDFEGNECDVWEEDLCDVSWYGNWLSVLLKKMFR